MTLHQGREIASALIDWYGQYGRSFPWRQGTSAYGTLVCEVMSQQTQMARVVPFWQRWMAQWPTVKALATASEADVVHLWQGLGYYSRGKNLRAAAQKLVDLGFDDVPYDEAVLASLPGVGPYTRAALLALAFDCPVTPLDGNLRRVLARLTGEEGVVGTASVDHRLCACCEALMAHSRPSLLAQALMDLGAGPCSPKAQCLFCPLQSFCVAFKEDKVALLPKTKKKPPLKRRFAAVLVNESDRGFALRRRPAGGLWSGFYELPWKIGESESESPELLAQVLAQELGFDSITALEVCETLRFTSWQVEAHFFRCTGPWSERYRAKDALALPMPAGLKRGLRKIINQA